VAEHTRIAWADGTFNSWWGCTRITKACKNCYAEAQSRRFGESVWGDNAPRRFFGDKHWNEPIRWNRKAEKEGVQRRIFAGSMCDVFEDRRDLFFPRMRLFRLVEDTPFLTWMFCTKRPQNYHRLLPASWLGGPRPNVWLLATASDQDEFDTAANELIRVPAMVRGISVEPMLGPISRAQQWMQRGWFRSPCPAHTKRFELECVDCIRQPTQDLPRINWVVVGGESGPGARPVQSSWVRALRDQCADTRTAFFFKQMGSRGHKGKGAELTDIPEDLQIKEFPQCEDDTATS
jgi:protein gp37